MIGNNCTIVISSCDIYETAWYPFFELFKKYWPNCPYKIVLSTETKTFKHKDLNIRTINHRNQNATWSERLYDCLSKIDTKYVILMLEDYFLQKNVSQNEINKCYSWMEQDADIACFYFKSVMNSHIESFFSDYYIADESLKFRLNTQAALWNRKIFMSFLDKTENPWDFEIQGSKRIFDTDKKLFCHKTSSIFSLDGPFPYALGHQTGYGITKGKWLWNNKKLFRHNRISVNYKELGIDHRWQHNVGLYAKLRRIILPLLVKTIKFVLPKWALRRLKTTMKHFRKVG